MNNNQKTPRRTFFKNTAQNAVTLSAGLTIAGSLLQSFKTPEAIENESANFQQAMNEKEFRMGVIGPAELSKVTSQIATEKATNHFAKEFAGFELTEAIAVTSVLTDLGTPVPAMTAKAQDTLNRIKAAPAGAEFDKLYIQAQLENHEFLRDLAQNFLSNSKANTPAESQGRHLATLSLAVFKEHVAITKEILTAL